LIKRLLYNSAYRLKGLNLSNVHYIGTGVRFNNASFIFFNGEVSIADGVRMWCETKSAKSNLTIEDNSQINRDVLLDFTGHLHIKKNVLVSEGAILYTHSHGYDPRSIPTPSSLIINDNVWIGTRAIILPSVNTIGARSIIGAGAIVSKDVPADTIVISQPQRMLNKVKES
jgi:acetyltransferase-like isoleucine patch superfamily enzyme